MVATRVQTTATNIVSWVRDAAGVINRAWSKIEGLDGEVVKKDGADIYTGDTAGVAYSQAKTQAMMDAIKALSDRLK